MYKKLIKKHLKATISEAQVPGISVTKKAQDDSKKENEEAMKDEAKRMEDYEDASAQEDTDSIEPPKRNLDPAEKTYHEEYEDMNGMESLRYDGVVDDKFKDRAEKAIAGDPTMGNDPNWANVYPEQQGFSGPEFGKRLIDKIKASAKKKAAATQALYQFGDDIEVAAGDPKISKRNVAVESTEGKETIKENNKPEINENKMKRLKFKEPFNGRKNALNLIPEHYKVDNKVFEMTDGVETYKVRWEKDTPVILAAKNQKRIDEDVDKMKHLMGYNSRETFGTLKGEERIIENTKMRDFMDKSSTLITEDEEGNRIIKEHDNEPMEKEDSSSKLEMDAKEAEPGEEDTGSAKARGSNDEYVEDKEGKKLSHDGAKEIEPASGIREGEFDGEATETPEDAIADAIGDNPKVVNALQNAEAELSQIFGTDDGAAIADKIEAAMGGEQISDGVVEEGFNKEKFAKVLAKLGLSSGVISVLLFTAGTAVTASGHGMEYYDLLQQLPSVYGTTTGIAVIAGIISSVLKHKVHQEKIAAKRKNEI